MSEIYQYIVKSFIGMSGNDVSINILLILIVLAIVATVTIKPN